MGGGAVAEVACQSGSDVGGVRCRAAGVHGDVCGLVDDQQVVVLVNDIQRQTAGGKLLRRTALEKQDGYCVAGAHDGVDVGGEAVEQDGVFPPFEAFQQGVGNSQLAAQNIAQWLVVALMGNYVFQCSHKITIP